MIEKYITRYDNAPYPVWINVRAKYTLKNNDVQFLFSKSDLIPLSPQATVYSDDWLQPESVLQLFQMNSLDVNWLCYVIENLRNQWSSSQYKRKVRMIYDDPDDPMEYT